jgi:SAM-dependent methyltransferase
MRLECAAVAPEYRDFYYPLNVFMHVLTLEEGGVAALHYGLFARDDEPISVAQRRSTDLLLARLPPPPAALLEVGIGLGDTLAELTRRGYDAIGITPDDQQIAVARARNASLNIVHAPLETFTASRRFDVVLFQESSQYIASPALWERMAQWTDHVIVLDEFSITGEGTLHRLDEFLSEAHKHGFAKIEEQDLTTQAAPTITYFTARLPRYRDPLIRDLGLTSEQVDELIASGATYRAQYDRGAYGYRLLVFER